MSIETKQEHPKWECVVDAKAKVAEAPIWSSDETALYWIDVYGPSINRTVIDSSGSTITRTWTLPEPVGSYGLSDDGTGAVVALRDGLFYLTFNSEKLTKIHDAPYDLEYFRFNDGRCDSQGRFWVGTTGLRGAPPLPNGSGAFWRLDSRGLSREIDDITVANSIAFSPGGDVMYLSDRPGSQILAFDYNATIGVASNRRQFARVPKGSKPDGAAVDTEGGYWIAIFGSGRILRFLPDGKLDRDLKAPGSHPTMVAFGGPDYEILYVTTSRMVVDDETLKSEPLAGGIFRADVKAKGIAEPRFRMG